MRYKSGDLISKLNGEKGIVIRQSRDSPFVFATFNPSANFGNFETYTTEAVNILAINPYWYAKGCQICINELRRWIDCHSQSSVDFLTTTKAGRNLLKKFREGIISEQEIEKKIMI